MTLRAAICDGRPIEMGRRAMPDTWVTRSPIAPVQTEKDMVQVGLLLQAG